MTELVIGQWYWHWECPACATRHSVEDHKPGINVCAKCGTESFTITRAQYEKRRKQSEA